MSLRIHHPKEVAARRGTTHRRKSSEITRCRCGCGKPAEWPRDGRPLFYSRLCGYLFAVKMFRRKRS